MLASVRPDAEIFSPKPPGRAKRLKFAKHLPQDGMMMRRLLDPTMHTSVGLFMSIEPVEA